jgi:hypothetical protein
VARATDVDELVQAVERSRATLLAVVAGLTETQAAYRPAGGWSVAEVLEHLYLAEISGVAKIWTALDELKSGSGWSGGRPNRGKPIEEVVAATWKPLEVAPPIATPHIGGPLEFWLSATNSLRDILAALGAALEGVPLEEVVYPHFLSGPLDAGQRLAFLRFHIDRHVGQIARIRSTPGFPA